jgi:hypothetical protein
VTVMAVEPDHVQLVLRAPEPDGGPPKGER